MAQSAVSLNSPGAVLQGPEPPRTRVADEVTSIRWKDYLASLDWRVGQTKNKQTYSAALRAASLGIEENDVHEVIAELIQQVHGDYDPEKVDRQIERAYNYVRGESGGTSGAARPKYLFNPDALKSVASKIDRIDERWLALRSPRNPLKTDLFDFLRSLYHPGETVIIFDDFRSQGQQAWSHSGFERGTNDIDRFATGCQNGVWFLVQPVDGEYHPNPREGGKPSRRSMESVTAWRYLVLECDHEEEHPGVNALWLSALVQMPLPIAAIYTSGGKSIHALVTVNANSKEAWDEIKSKIVPIVVPLGADEQAMTAVRLSRLPGCQRGAGMQRLLYLNHRPDGTPIVEGRIHWSERIFDGPPSEAPGSSREEGT